ncbi:MAG: hypothetical protein QM689_12730 [Oscillospiraceae bacterium]
MAKMTIRAEKDFEIALSRLEAKSEVIGRKAIYAAANIVTDEIRRNIDALPEEPFKKLNTDMGEEFQSVPKNQKKDLQDSLGISGIAVDRDGNLNTKVGFDDYGYYTTKKYPQGVPNALTARSIESGSSVRQKTPFVRPAVNKTKNAVKAAMSKVIEEETKKIMKG